MWGPGPIGPVIVSWHPFGRYRPRGTLAAPRAVRRILVQFRHRVTAGAALGPETASRRGSRAHVRNLAGPRNTPANGQVELQARVCSQGAGARSARNGCPTPHRAPKGAVSAPCAHAPRARLPAIRRAYRGSAKGGPGAPCATVNRGARGARPTRATGGTCPAGVRVLNASGGGPRGAGAAPGAPCAALGSTPAAVLPGASAPG